MKKIAQLLLSCFAVLAVHAQTPELMTYQAVVRNATNQIIATSPVGMRISILQGSAFGSAVYMETHVASTNANGLVSVNIGGGTPVVGTFAGINWANGPYFIKTETDPAGGSNYTITGTTQLVSVPYALFAKKTGYDGDSSSSNELQTVSQSGNTVTLSKGGGSFTVDDADASTSNEIQTLNRSGYTLSLSNGGGSVQLGDGDTSSSNELQSLTLVGSTLSLSNGGGSVTLPSGGSNYWQPNGSNIYYTAGRVGIGKSAPGYPLHVGGTMILGSGSDYYGSLFEFTGGSASGYGYHGLRVNLASGGDGVQRALVGAVSGVSNTTSGSSITGVTGMNTGSGFVCRGMQGWTTATATYNQAVFGRCDGAGDGTSSSSNVGTYGYSTNNAYFNVGAQGIADYTGSTGANYGVYGSASNGAAAYAGYFNGDVTVTGTFANPSDQKLKKDIQPMESALQRLMGLQVKSYLYDNAGHSSLNLPAGRQFGFLAQDLERTYPELVTAQKHVFVKPEGGATDIFEYKAINYIGLIPVLTKAIQEQQVLIEQLQQRIAQLEQTR